MDEMNVKKKNSDNENEMNELERLIFYLTHILEYDQSYFEALSNLKIKRSIKFFNKEY